jgi:hypothetical protein
MASRKRDDLLAAKPPCLHSLTREEFGTFPHQGPYAAAAVRGVKAKTRRCGAW